MNGLNFQNFPPNLSQNWLKFTKILEKSSDFAQNLAQNWNDWYMNGSTFSHMFASTLTQYVLSKSHDSPLKYVDTVTNSANLDPFGGQ